ncbi:VOC family protein [Nocardia sp. N2S4-5]|uniref:VOC family protein n=1 Tax=Nocardia sp. N2S4-5 TaxID=3351565 RepID=UPI0037D8A495
MITGISIVSVPVDDTDDAIEFYCGVLGMEKRKDLPMGGDTRYVEVAPPGSLTALSPYTYYTGGPAQATIGEYSRMVLRVDDVHRAYTELGAKGVKFVGEPFSAPGGIFVKFVDPWNNLYLLTDNTDF